MKITANQNDINDILQMFQLLLLTSSVHCKQNCIDLATRSCGQSGEMRCKTVKNVKGCFGSDVVARSIRSHMTQLDTRRW